MKTKICATLFAFAFAASIGFPAAAADDTPGRTSFYASGPSASTVQFQSLSTVRAVPLSPKVMDATRGTALMPNSFTGIPTHTEAGYYKLTMKCVCLVSYE